MYEPASISVLDPGMFALGGCHIYLLQLHHTPLHLLQFHHLPLHLLPLLIQVDLLPRPIPHLLDHLLFPAGACWFLIPSLHCLSFLSLGFGFIDLLLGRILAFFTSFLFWPTPKIWLPATVWRDQIFDRYRDRDFLSETNFSDTNTETFLPRPNFPRPIPRLFFRDQIFRYQYRDFFFETKFFDTDTETFLSRPNFWIPIPKLSKNCHGSRDWDRDF